MCIVSKLFSIIIIILHSWSQLPFVPKIILIMLYFQVTLGRSTQYTTTITGIDWQELGDSEALTQLRKAAGDDGELSVRITMNYYTRNYEPYAQYNFTLGRIVGSIGVQRDGDTLNVPGDRAMFTKNDPIGMHFDEDDLCYMQNISAYAPWTNTAAFVTDKERSEVRIDLSNSIPTDLGNSLRDIGALRLGILMDSCVYLLGGDNTIPYASTDEVKITSGIYAISVDPLLMDTIAKNPLVLVQVLSTEEGNHTVCAASKSKMEKVMSVQIVLEELPYYVRPVENYFNFLDRKSMPSMSVPVYVTLYGEPVEGVQAIVLPFNFHLLQRNPINGVVPTSWNAVTDEKGIAVFTIGMNEDVIIPPKRHYTHPPCHGVETPDNRTIISIDGQEYLYYYCVDVPGVNCVMYSYIASYFLAFSDVSYTRPYTWVKDVAPILTQYAGLFPAMKKVLDLSSYHQVTLTRNINLLNTTLRLDINDPSYMPTTRDLSTTKKEMILEWLQDPKFDHLDSKPSEGERSCTSINMTIDDTHGDFIPPRCRAVTLLFEDEPCEHDPMFESIFMPTSYFYADIPLSLPPRPLYNNQRCTVSGVKKQLQLAVELEWLTVPVYLTTLYSIVEDCNKEISELIRSIVEQEMLHMTQAANILIAMGGSPLIDHPSAVHTLPATGLPGGVLPNLKVTLEKLTLEHVYEVFLGIETPQKSYVSHPVIINQKNTIGAFYNELRDCITYLGDEVFNPAMVDRQVQWPWTPERPVGDVVLVKDTATALEAIDMIVSQGEGTDLLSPLEIGSDTLAHFYKFEEIVCRKHLEKVDELNYAYTGGEIPFNAKGVYPMRPNPSAATVIPHTNCYTESRAFHQVYRMLLRKMQEIFNGYPEEVFSMVTLMESLQAHAKRVMWTAYNPDDPDDDSTCGPVWDYAWPE